MCAGLCPTYWTTFGSAEKNRNGSVHYTNETTVHPHANFGVNRTAGCREIVDRTEKKQKNTYSKTNTSPFALTSEWRVIIISRTMFMVLSSWQSYCESSPGSFDECRTASSGRRPKTKPDDSGCESACTGCQNLHPPSPIRHLLLLLSPKSWYSFYRPTEGKRLSRPSWLVKYRDGLPVHRRSPILVLTVSRPTRYH